MKKVLALVLAVVLALAFPLECICAEPLPETQQTIEYFDDGSYLITTITYEPSIFRASTRSGNATASYRNALGAVQFEITVTATFTYDQVTATATSAKESHRIVNSEWTCRNSIAYYSGNTATAHAAFSNSSTSKDIDVTLTCSPSGVLS